MERLYADCAELPSEGHCAAVIAADTEAELLEAAAKHARDIHGHKDCPELRNALRQTFHRAADDAPQFGGKWRPRPELNRRPTA